MHVVLCIIGQIRELYRAGRDAVMVTTDVASTFPSIRLEVIRKRMVEAVGVEDKYAGRWIYGFMNKRRIRMLVNRVETEDTIIRSGTPQGSPLSPILFAICLVDTLEERMVNYV